MKKQKPEKSIGVWMDHAEAKLIEPGKLPSTIRVILSPVESRVRIDGEGADGTRLGGYRSTNNENHKHNRENNEIHLYYKQLAEVLMPYDRIFICGPATARKEFHNYLQEEKHFFGKRIFSKALDYLTENQIVEYINSNLSEE